MLHANFMQVVYYQLILQCTSSPKSIEHCPKKIVMKIHIILQYFRVFGFCVWIQRLEQITKTVMYFCFPVTPFGKGWDKSCYPQVDSMALECYHSAIQNNLQEVCNLSHQVLELVTFSPNACQEAYLLKCNKRFHVLGSTTSGKGQTGCIAFYSALVTPLTPNQNL